jgi:apolipoprotein D and lipocalin family protein
MWYEVARLPMWAQRHCVRSTAEYRLLESGEVNVRNACVTSTGEEKSIEGMATLVDREHRAKLNVVFDQWAAKLVEFFTSSKRGDYGNFHLLAKVLLASPLDQTSCESGHNKNNEDSI